MNSSDSALEQSEKVRNAYVEGLKKDVRRLEQRLIEVGLFAFVFGLIAGVWLYSGKSDSCLVYVGDPAAEYQYYDP